MATRDHDAGSTAPSNPWPSSSDVHHCKEDALSDREFEHLVEATYNLDDDYFALECRFVVFAAGRLGLRAGEIAHMREDWIDWRRNMLVIPRHETCTGGRNGGLCGYCQRAAEQMADHNPGLSVAEAESLMWKPKTQNAAREVPIDATTRAAIAVERYFERFDAFQKSRVVVNRRVTRAAEQARDVDPETTYPHALRATAASYYAARGLNSIALKAMMGWASMSTSLNYIEESGERTAQALRDIRA